MILEFLLRACAGTATCASITTSALRADIAPTQYIGSGVVVLGESTTVRMESADVRIVWGTPCTLAATFTMVNDSAVAEEIEIGFPMPTPHLNWAGFPNTAADPLTISFDGQDSVVTPPAPQSPPMDHSGEWRWYRCRHTFALGKTTIEVRTVLRASRVYGRLFQESLFYCIESGGSWAGAIGEEVVTMEFSGPIAMNQITVAAPAGYEIDGNLLRWRLRDFEPKARELDIAVTYIRPDVLRTIAALRAAHAADPQSAAGAIKLARHLLVLGYAKSNSGFPPSRLTAEKYAALGQAIDDRDARATFADHYRRQEDGSYQAVDSASTEQRLSLVQILADSGYRDDTSREAVICESEALLQEVLQREPKHAEAWNLYLANYWRFSFAAIGHWFGTTVVSKQQAELIRTAARHCPEDPWIQYWQRMLEVKLSGGHESSVEKPAGPESPTLEFDRVEYDYL